MNSNGERKREFLAYLIQHGGKKGTGLKWIEIAEMFNMNPNTADPIRRAKQVKERWQQFLGSKRGIEFKKATFGKDGSIDYLTMGRAQEPDEIPDTSDLELKFVTQTPNGGAYVRHEKPKQKRLSRKDIEEVIQETAITPIKGKEWKEKKKTGYSQVLSLGDVHIGMATDDSIFELQWNKKQLFKRADKFLGYVDPNAKELILIFGGDIADGLKGMTNRGGHNLPQNLNDKEQLRVSKDFILYLLDNINSITDAKVKVYFIANSNHPGIIDLATGEIVKAIAPDRYGGQVDFHIEESFFGNFKVNGKHFIYTHGYDEQYMKRGMPRFLRPKDVELVEKYMDHKNIKRAFLFRFDQHQSSQIVYNKFIDIMTPAFSNPSSWVSLNFSANYKGGFVNAEISENGEMKYKLVEF